MTQEPPRNSQNQQEEQACPSKHLPSLRKIPSYGPLYPLQSLGQIDPLELKRGLKGMLRMIGVLLGMIGNLWRFPGGPLGEVRVRGVLIVSVQIRRWCVLYVSMCHIAIVNSLVETTAREGRSSNNRSLWTYSWPPSISNP
jgi:hypothetical protein